MLYKSSTTQLTYKHMQQWHKHQQSQVPIWLLEQQVLSQDPLDTGHLKDHLEEDRLEEDGPRDHQEDHLEDGLKDHQEDHWEEDGRKDHQKDRDQLHMAGSPAL